MGLPATQRIRARAVPRGTRHLGAHGHGHAHVRSAQLRHILARISFILSLFDIAASRLNPPRPLRPPGSRCDCERRIVLDSVFATVGRWVGTRGGREAFIAVSEMKEARKYKTERRRRSRRTAKPIAVTHPDRLQRSLPSFLSSFLSSFYVFEWPLVSDIMGH